MCVYIYLYIRVYNDDQTFRKRRYMQQAYIYDMKMVQVPSGDTTPCKVTPVILHGVVSPEEIYPQIHPLPVILRDQPAPIRKPSSPGEPLSVSTIPEP